MSQPLTQLHTVAQMLAEGAVLLTPNIRAARQWRARVEHFWAEQGRLHRSAQVLPWQGWTAELYRQLLLAGEDDRVPMNALQFSALWQNVLSSEQPTTLRPVRSLAKLCGEAHVLLHRYSAVNGLLHLSESAQRNSSEDARQFRRWLRDVEGRCAAERLLPPAAMEVAVAESFDRGTAPGAVQLDRGPALDRPHPLRVAPHYLLTGFDRLVPAQERLLAAVTRAGSRVEHIATLAEAARSAGTRPRLIEAPDSRSEMLVLAKHLRQALATPGPSRRLSVVVPDLQASRPALERVLREVVAPELQDVACHASPPWEFSTGLPLSQLPLIAHALFLLRWVQAPLPVSRLSELLLSPFAGCGLTPEAAAEMDAVLLRGARRLRPEWTMPALAASCQDRWPTLANRLRDWHRKSQDFGRGKRAVSEWIALAANLLDAMGWPGQRAHTSEEFQMVQRWNELLDQISSLDLLEAPITFPEFLAHVEQWTAETTFAPENTDAPLQFITPAEAAGTVTGLLWCGHADERRWSTQRALHPLLPWSLQTEFGMPGTSPARDAAEAHAALHRLDQGAGQIVFSYAAFVEDGEAQASALLNTFENMQRETASALQDEVAPAALEAIDDTEHLPALPDGAVTGGVAVLKSQAACAFRAFAERRLFSTPLDFPDLGLDAAQRGNLMHRVLEAFWSETRTQARLLELRSSGELRNVLLRQIDENLRTSTGDAWSLAYLRIQRERLCRLLLRWLDLESDRPPFRVLDTEHRIAGLEIGSLRMNVRVDRVDEVELDGSKALVLIDYKSGSVHVNNWMGDRPEEPQLPLYAVASGLGNVAAIAFGSMKAGEKHLGLKSFPPKSPLLAAASAESDPDLFASQMEQWQVTLEQLAADFAAGHASVGPREYPGTCKYCEQRMLCRLNPELLEAAADDADAEEAE